MLSKIRGKMAQGSVPVVILLLAIFLIFYIYSLPKEEKCSLMPDLKECKIAEAEKTAVEPVIVLSDNPGFLESQEKSSVYSLKPIELFNNEEVEIATILEKERVEKSWFGSAEKKGIFPVHAKGKELKVFIYVSSAKGKLKVNINPHLSYIFKGAGLHEISVPIGLLEDTNVIRFSVSIPLLPPETNFYEIEKVIIKETYSKTDLYAKREFFIEQDLLQLEHAELSFNADCLTKELLGVTLNGNQLIKEIVCGSINPDVTGQIKEQNELIFSSNGNYLIHPIKINLYFTQKNYTTYYLVLDGEEFKKIKHGKVLAMLKFEFDSTQHKDFDIKINDEILSAETNQAEYKTRINDYLFEGVNRIKIVPRTPVMVKKIELSLE